MKKIISVILCVCLLLSVIPVMAFAKTVEPGEITLSENDTLVITPTGYSVNGKAEVSYKGEYKINGYTNINGSPAITFENSSGSLYSYTVFFMNYFAFDNSNSTSCPVFDFSGNSDISIDMKFFGSNHVLTFTQGDVFNSSMSNSATVNISLLVECGTLNLEHTSSLYSDNIILSLLNTKTEDEEPFNKQFNGKLLTTHHFIYNNDGTHVCTDENCGESFSCFPGECKDNGDGTHSYYCYECKNKLNTANHNYAYSYNNEQQHCKYCTDCKHIEGYEDHEYTDFENTGSQYFHKAACSKCKFESLINHNFTYSDVTLEPTATTCGKIKANCSVCGFNSEVKIAPTSAYVLLLFCNGETYIDTSVNAYSDGNEIGTYTLYKNETEHEYIIPVDSPNSSLSLYINNNLSNIGYKLYAPGEYIPCSSEENIDDNNWAGREFFSVNCANYSRFDAVGKTIPADASKYTYESYTNATNLYYSVNRHYSVEQQSIVNEKTEELKSAIMNLVPYSKAEPSSDMLTLDLSQGRIRIYETGYRINSEAEVPFTGRYVLTGTGTDDGRVYIYDGNYDITLSDANINTTTSGIVVLNSQVRFTLKGINNIRRSADSNQVLPVFGVDETSCVIFDGDGTLNVTSDSDSISALGGMSGAQKTGTIIINGGTINAVSNGESSAIGGNNDADFKNIVINGGTIYAESTKSGAAIGGGKNAAGDNIIITGGELVLSSAKGPAIGSLNMLLDNIEITGGVIYVVDYEGYIISCGSDERVNRSLAKIVIENATILSDNPSAISPQPVNSDGENVYPLSLSLDNYDGYAKVDLSNNESEIAFFDGGTSTIYQPSGVTALNVSQYADYTAVDNALSKVPSDLSIYTDESVAALNQAVANVSRDYSYTRQNEVNEMANEINTAISNLELTSTSGSEKSNAGANTITSVVIPKTGNKNIIFVSFSLMSGALLIFAYEINKKRKNRKDI